MSAVDGWALLAYQGARAACSRCSSMAASCSPARTASLPSSLRQSYASAYPRSRPELCELILVMPTRKASASSPACGFPSSPIWRRQAASSPDRNTTGSLGTSSMTRQETTRSVSQ